jgi:hypothetical protein
VFAAVYFARQLLSPTRDYPPRTAASTGDTTSAINDGRADEVVADAVPPVKPRDTAADASRSAVDDGDRDAGTDPASVQWLTPALLVAALCGYAYVLEPVGFLLSTVVFFVLAVWILGSRHLIRDGLIGVVLSAVIYFSFTQLLAISLPMGVLPI